LSLYEIAIADGNQCERGSALLSMIGFPAVARFRDAWVEKGEDGPVIAVYTPAGRREPRVLLRRRRRPSLAVFLLCRLQ
jgi:hypothetical protein